MIESERQADAVRRQIAYWKNSLAAGDQSWLAGENARREIGRLHRQMDEYRRRQASHSS